MMGWNTHSHVSGGAHAVSGRVLSVDRNLMFANHLNSLIAVWYWTRLLVITSTLTGPKDQWVCQPMVNTETPNTSEHSTEPHCMKRAVTSCFSAFGMQRKQLWMKIEGAGGFQMHHQTPPGRLVRAARSRKEKPTGWSCDADQEISRIAVHRGRNKKYKESRMGISDRRSSPTNGHKPVRIG